MKTNSYQPLLIPINLALPEAWRPRLRDVVARIRPYIAAMKPGQSRTIDRVSAKLPSAVVVKLSIEPGRCQALALLSADTVLLMGTARVQVLHRGQAYEASLEHLA